MGFGNGVQHLTGVEEQMKLFPTTGTKVKFCLDFYFNFESNVG